MNRRTPDRFQVYSSAKITLLELPGRELDGLLIDVSASGMKLVLAEPLPAEQPIALEVETHLILADVRYSTPRGSKFTVGAERIHAFSKLSLPEGATRTEKIQALVDDFHHRLRTGLEATGTKPGTRIGSGTVQIQQSQEQPWEAEQSATPETREAVSELEPPAASPTPEAGPVVVAAPRRGMDDTPLFNSIRDRAISIGVTAGLATLVVVALFARPTRGSNPETSKVSAEERTVVYRRPADAATQIPPAATGANPRVASHSASAPADSAGLRMNASMKATETSWVSACSDGQKIFEGVVGLGQTKKIEFSDRAQLWVGNAGGMEIALDGRPIGSLGHSGQVRVIQFEREGFRFLEVKGRTGSCLPGDTPDGSSPTSLLPEN